MVQSELLRGGVSIYVTLLIALALCMGANLAKAQGPYYLRAHWDFTNAFAVANDISGNGHNGTVIGCVPVPDCSGVPNQALRFRPGNFLEVTAGQVGSKQKFTKL